MLDPHSSTSHELFHGGSEEVSTLSTVIATVHTSSFNIAEAYGMNFRRTSAVPTYCLSHFTGDLPVDIGTRSHLKSPAFWSADLSLRVEKGTAPPTSYTYE